MKEFVDAAKARQSAVQDGRHRLQARGPRPHRVHGEEDRREVRLPAVQVGRRGGDAARRQPHRSPTSTIRRRTSKSGAPARCARCACSTRSASQYKTKVTDTQSWNDIPTCKEEGLDVQYLMLRAMFLPGKVTPEQTAFYVDLFKKVTQTPEYKDYMEKQALKPIFLTGKDMLQVPRGGRRAQQGPDDRSRLRRASNGRLHAVRMSGDASASTRRRSDIEIVVDDPTRRRRLAAVASTAPSRSSSAAAARARGAARLRQLAHRHGWAPDGPQAGYFPFYLSRDPRRRLRSTASSRRSSRGTQPASRSSRATSCAACCRCSCRRSLFCLLMQWLGLYVASFLLVAGFMRVRRAHRAGGSRC